MSRDFTPEQLFLADYSQKNALRNSTITWESPQGDTIRVDNHLVKDRYPELSFLYDGFDELYKRYSDSDKVLDVLDKIEKSITEAEVECLSGELPFTTEFDTTVQAWFKGELDANFYYHEENDRLFSEFIEKQIEALEHKGHGTIIALAGASGSGKDTLRNALEELGYERIVTSTTRSPRPNEKDGIDYNFMSVDDFEKAIADGSVFEYRKYESSHGTKYYGSQKQELDPNKDYVIVLDDTGIEDYQKAYGKENIFAVLVEVSEEVRFDRAFAREFPEKRADKEKVKAFNTEWEKRAKDDTLRLSSEFITNSINYRLDNEYLLDDVVKALKEAQGAYERTVKPNEHCVVSEKLESGKLVFDTFNRNEQKHRNVIKE